MLTNILIENFRIFNHLEINDFKKVNLFIGKNNAGKSSLLESIFLLIGMSNPTLLATISGLRGLNIKNASDLKNLFHNMDIENKPALEGLFSDGTKRKLILSPLFQNKNITSENNWNIEAFVGTTDVASSIKGLILDFSLKTKNETREYKSFILDNYAVPKFEIAPEYKEYLDAVFLTGLNDSMGVLNRYSEIVRKKQGDKILELLQKLDSNIESVISLPDGIYLGYKNIKEMIPLQVAGDGIKKYMSILTAILEKKYNIVLIDEIENGLHYSAHKFLWEQIFSLSQEFNIQIFITTHSLDSLKCLNELLNEKQNEKYRDDLNIYKVSNTKKGIKTYSYSSDSLKTAIETETEIR